MYHPFGTVSNIPKFVLKQESSLSDHIASIRFGHAGKINSKKAYRHGSKNHDRLCFLSIFSPDIIIKTLYIFFKIRYRDKEAVLIFDTLSTAI
jgi:hypothetical protein